MCISHLCFYAKKEVDLGTLNRSSSKVFLVTYVFLLFFFIFEEYNEVLKSI